MQVVNGAIGLAVPSLDKVKEQLASVVTSGVLRETQFRVEDDVPGVGIAVRCPYGNLFHVYEAKRHLPGLPHREPEDGMSRFEQLCQSTAFNWNRPFPSLHVSPWVSTLHCHL